MTIDQRNDGASVTATNAGYTLDRWRTLSSAASKFTVQRSSTAPTGFIYSALITSSSAYAVGVSEAFVIEQVIEGFNISDLGWGTANAVPATLTFQVRSSLTGTFGGVIKPASYDYTFPFTYTIAVANTWETKTINVAGPTVATFGIGITAGARVMFGLGVGSTSSGTADGTWGSGDFYSATGSVSVVGTSGATFYITGVQLEAGSTASSFAHENYGDTLRKCQRYYQRIESSSGLSVSALYAQFNVPFPVEMRATPTGSISDANGVVCARITDHYTADSTVTSGATISLSNASKNGARVQIGSFSGLTTGRFVGFLPGGSYSSFMRFDAEL